MTKQSISARRLAENEVVFRQRNEGIQEGFAAARQIAAEDGQKDLLPDNDVPLHFYCECSDENCRLRIIMKPSKYQAVHRKRNDFIIIPGHQTNAIEKVIDKRSAYSIVRKYIKPPQSAVTLNPTPLHNV